MISFESAQSIIAQATPKAKIETLDLLESLNRICAIDIFAKINVPSFDNSAMDGFGVKVKWLENATQDTIVFIQKTQTIAAGQIIEQNNDLSTCHIMTGAKIPNWVEAIIPIENTTKDNDSIGFNSPAFFGQNIRRIGEDIKIGDKLIEKNSQITPEKIMALAAQGINEIQVYSRPKVKIISTGNELKPYNSGPLVDGQIYNSNAPYLISKLKELNLEVEFSGIYEDNIEKFTDFLKSIDDNSIIISTGAVSAGKWDFIPEALKLSGANIHFHKVNIRPGKPIIFATLENGSLFFGLPGNPISSAIGFDFFVKHALQNMFIIPRTQLLKAKLQNNFSKKFNGTQFLKAITNYKDETFQTEILDGQESFKIQPFAYANSWVIADEKQYEMSSGALVDICFFNKG